MSEAAATSPVVSLLAQAFSQATGPDDAGHDPHGDVLDAARDLFAVHGIQRTTMEDVARAAGLSRITIYRRMESKEALVEQVVMREFRRYFDRFLVEIAEAHTLADRVVVGFAGSLRAIRGNALISGVIAAEPGLVAPSIVGEGGRTLAVVGQFLAGQLRREQAAGHVGADVDVDVVAELMVRLTSSLLVIPSRLIDLDDDEQLEAIARDYLVPLLRPATA